MEEQSCWRVVEVQDGRPRRLVLRRGEEELLKNLGHFRRLEGEVGGLPPLPTHDDAPDLVPLLDAFLAALPPPETEVEIAQFFGSSLPRPEVWGELAQPKVRPCEVDILLSMADGLLPGSQNWVAVISNASQRYASAPRTASASGEAVWVETATLTCPSMAAWFCVTLLSNGTPHGIVRVPVLSCFSTSAPAGDDDGDDADEWVDVRWPLLRLPGGEPTGQHIVARVWAGRKGRRDRRRGLAVEALPIRLDTGDIIFMKMNKLVAWFNRLVTWSDWDHVAVVVGGRRPALLEATSDSGVAVHEIEVLLERYKAACSELGVVRLRMERTELTHQACAAFAKEVRGLPYNWNVIDMVTTTPEEEPENHGRHFVEPVQVAERDEATSQVASKKSAPAAMFCSQLVAATLHRLGVLPKHVAPDNYLPRTLSSPDLKVSHHVAVDPLVKFEYWDGDVRAPEAAWVALVEKNDAESAHWWPLEHTQCEMTMSWKSFKTGDKVCVVGTTIDGFFIVQGDGQKQVPSAFVKVAKKKLDANK